MEENLLLCLVRPAPANIDRVGCFELVTPTRAHTLQADSESLCNDWMRALQRTIMALHEGGGMVNYIYLEKGLTRKLENQVQKKKFKKFFFFRTILLEIRQIRCLLEAILEIIRISILLKGELSQIVVSDEILKI